MSEFLGSVASSVSQVTKNISWGDECDEEDIVSIALPTAPRSTRVLDDSTIPTSPPFLAYMTNLPYDLNEEDLQQYFEEQLDCEVVSVRLPRDDKDGGRMRGFGYVEFKERSDLIEAVSLPDPQIRNRRIRIDVSNENDQKRSNTRSRYDNFGSSDRGDTNWRRDDGTRPPEEDREAGRRGGYNYGGNRERQREYEPAGSGGSGGGGGSQDGGNWRSGDRPKQESPPPARRNYQERDREGGDRFGGGRDRDRFGGGRRNNGFEERPRREEGDTEEERPKLQLKPRTLPLPEIEIKPDDDETKAPGETSDEVAPPAPRPKPVPAAAIFGAAKPVDTAAKDREIEERLEKERLEKKALEEKEKEEKEKAAAAAAEANKDNKDNKNNKENKENKENEDGEPTEQTEESAPAPEKEAISWRRKNDDEVEPSRTQSPPRRRFSPSRNRNRRNGKTFF